jgi:D-beta-D-heptose 7-phosphate kinase/D-beta-D-heptose 1-phosphate adenosyltransferase
MKNKVLVVGDTILDIYTHTTMSRISPEAQVPILTHGSTRYVLGGASNVFRNLLALDCDSNFITVLGNDEYTIILNDLLRESLNPNNSELRNYCSSQISYMNTVKHRFLAGNTQLYRLDRDNKHKLNMIDEYHISKMVSDYLSSGDYSYMILSDYNKGMLSEELIRWLIEIATKYDVLVLVDTKKKDLTCFNGAFLITPNESEWESATKSALFKNILITKGEKGMHWLNQNTFIDAIPVTNPDVSGAGDTVMATIASELAKGTDLLTSFKIASLAASIVVSKPGTAVCYKSELEKKISQGYLKICYTTKQLLQQVKDWRSQKVSIGVVNGCFDILHSGHLDLIRFAKSICDKLIVLLNDDNYITKVKGTNRPYTQNRIQQLAAIKDVDAVAYFIEETPKRLLHLISPDYHFVGPDYITSLLEVTKLSPQETETISLSKANTTIHTKEIVS